MRFHLITFGCRVNQYESQAIREQLLSAGYEEVTAQAPADIVVVNSCTVTANADKECMATLTSLRRQNPKVQLVVTGCLVQRDTDLLKQLPGVRLLVGNNQKHRVAELIQSLDPWDLTPRLELELSRVYAPLKVSDFKGHAKAFLKVQDGCDRSCTFCKIPYVRGRSRSRSLPDILEEIRRLVDRGFQEIVLTGVALGLWGRERSLKGHLAQLIEEADRIPGRFRIRLSSLDPRDLDDGLIQALVSSRRICHHLHLSLQSGSDRVLARMNRGYTPQEYQRKVEALRRHWPDLGLTTDLIVGFPGETEEDFQETLRFCREIRCAKVHLFPYSRRHGTSAWFFKEQISPSLTKERAKRLREVAHEVACQFRRALLGTTQEVLVEEARQVSGQASVVLTGYTGNFIKVDFPGPEKLIGRLLPLEMVEVTLDGLLANFSPSTLDNLAQDVPCFLVEGSLKRFGTTEKG